MEECPVCFEAETTSVFLPCRHAYCHPCALSVAAFGCECHLCRQKVNAIASDRPPPAEVVLRLGSGRHAGVTLTNGKGGVRVLSLVRWDQAATALRKGDVLSHLNGVPTVHHRDVCAQLDRITVEGGEARLTLARRQFPYLSLLAKRAARFHAGRDAWREAHS